MKCSERPRRGVSQFGRVFVVLLSVASVAAWAAPVLAGETEAAIEKRLADDARYLSSDELEGRGLGSAGLDLAADHVARQFAEAGLKTDLFTGSPFQEFEASGAAELGKENRLALIGPPTTEGGDPQRIELELGEDWTPLAMSGSGEVDAPLAFVGYGITGKKENYDDYAGVDVKGKAVLMLRHEPQQDDPKSVFNGTKVSPHAFLNRKVANAREHGAVAVIFCTGRFEIDKNVARFQRKRQEALDLLAATHGDIEKVEDPTPEEIKAQRSKIEELRREVEQWSDKLQAERDPLLTFGHGGPIGGGSRIPVMHSRRAALDRILRAAVDRDLAAMEEQIDQGPAPQSRLLDGWRVVGKLDVQRKKVAVKNVIGVLEGEGPAADETVIVGAHYDHLGLGGAGSLVREEAIHNGADDNASGVAVMIEVARQLALRNEPLKRRLVFMALTGEERGLLGSSHYLDHPLFPLEKTVAMINLDMVGRLRNDRLTVFGSGSAKGIGQLLQQINERHGFKLALRPSGFSASDNAAFYAKKVPVLHFFTGTHGQYHRPSDDFETLNVAGMGRIAALVSEVVVALSNAEKPPEYVAIQRASRSAGRPYLGTVPDLGFDGNGYRLRAVVPGGPAERAGLREGDIVVRFADDPIDGLEAIDQALRKHHGGDRVRVVVRRGEQEETFEVELDPPK